MRRVLMINGPNLNLLGVREPHVYGSTTLPELERQVAAWGAKLEIEVVAFQSNHEGAIIDKLHAARDQVDGLILNLGAFTHSSYALHDAIVASDLPAVEVHISNIMQREPWRHRSVTAPACLYAIYGRGLVGYRDALRILQLRTQHPPQTITYGTSEEHVIDLRSPATPGPHPTAVFLHGGFWRCEWTRDTIDGLASDLHQRGWLTANVEYRRLDRGGGWPATRDDVARAIETIRALDDVDHRRLVLVGHSAGGHLALCAAEAAHATAVVGLAAITDVAAAHADGVGDGSVARFMGGPPGEAAAAYAAAVTTPATDVVLVHGADDHLVPVDQSRSYAHRYPEVTYIECAATGHFELLAAERDPWQQVVPLLPA